MNLLTKKAQELCIGNNNKLINSIIRIELENVLHNSKINHKNEICKMTSIKDIHIYCKINNLSGQVSGPLIEHFIKKKYNMIKNCSSLCIGDLKYNNQNLEIKSSNGGKNHNKFNFVQIRMNHDCNYLLTAFYLDENNLDDLGELFIFKLLKNDIKQLILKYGSYAHGTVKSLGSINKIDLDNDKNKREYALRPIYKRLCWNMLLQFRIYEADI